MSTSQRSGMATYIEQRHAQGVRRREAMREWRAQHPELHFALFRALDGWLERAQAWARRLQEKPPERS